MRCWVCNSELTWQSDNMTLDAYLFEDGEQVDDDAHAIETALNCPECEAFVIVYWGKLGEKPYQNN